MTRSVPTCVQVCGSDAPQELKDLLAPLDMAGMGGVAEARGFTALCSIKAALAVLAAFKSEAGLGFNPDPWRFANGVSLLVGAPRLQLPVGAVGTDGSNTMDSAFSGRGGVEGDVIGDGFVFGAAAAGALLPLLCAGLGVLAIGKATRVVVDDARERISASRDGGDPYKIADSVQGATREAAMGSVLPVWWAVMGPVFVGLLMGPRALAGFVAGAILGGGAVAIACANAGSCWAKSEVITTHHYAQN